MVYDGFWADGLEGSPDNMNATKVQISAAGSRPAAGLNGVVHIATDTGAISEDNGSTWDVRGYVASVGPGTVICHIKTGTYTGDGATSLAITGVGFAPKFVMVSKRQTSFANLGAQEFMISTDQIVDDGASGGGFSFGGGQTAFYENAIIALGADGFTVDDAGTDLSPNKASVVYNYLCLG